MELVTARTPGEAARQRKKRDCDHVPVVRWFNPAGAGTWLASELDPEDPDIAHCLADLGMGCPEIGSV